MCLIHLVVTPHATFRHVLSINVPDSIPIPRLVVSRVFGRPNGLAAYNSTTYARGMEAALRCLREHIVSKYLSLYYVRGEKHALYVIPKYISTIA